MNDILVKSCTMSTHLFDLGETFVTIKKFQMWLNPTKCAFGISLGKFLGFMSHRN